MFKKVITAVLIVTVLIIFVGCDQKATKEDFVGSWEATALIDKNEKYPDDYDKKEKMVSKAKKELQDTDAESAFLNYILLNKDGSAATFMGADNISDGKWKLTEDSVIFFDGEIEGYTKEYKIDFDNNKLLLKLEDGSMFVYTKNSKK